MSGVNNNNKIQFKGLLDRDQIPLFFNILKANIVRTKITFTVILLNIQSHEIFREEDFDRIEVEMTSYLQAQIRQTDILFKLPDSFEWCIMLAQSGEEEANAFLQRLFRTFKSENIPLFRPYNMSMSASIAEIGNDEVDFEEMLKNGRKALNRSVQIGNWHVEAISTYKGKKVEIIKVSILEENEIFKNVLLTTLKNLSIDHFQLDIKLFQDGFEFLQSDWYSTSHTHLIIMNDILPRKNGLEILHTIRSLPNNKRFIIYMMTRRNSERDMIFAYKSGIDEYLVKPFNIRLFEAQLKRTFERLWP
ncbi:MAG TPA: response regulator [Chondromyces sp.]|nr:response regulator [Chondromyces sp.]